MKTCEENKIKNINKPRYRIGKLMGHKLLAQNKMIRGKLMRHF